MAGIEISKKLIVINSMSSAVALVLNLSILVWLQQYLLKHISAEEYSLVPIVLSIMAFAPLLTTVLTGGLGRYMTVAYAQDDEAEVTRICSTMFPILLLAGVVFLALGWLAAWHVDSILVIAPEYLVDAQIMLALMVFVTALKLPQAAFNSGFMVRQKLMWQDMIDVGCQFLRIALLMVLLLEVSTRALWVTVALVISELANMAISTPVSMKLVPAQRFRPSLFKRKLAIEISKFGSWWFVGSLSDVVKRTMDPILLNRFASAVDVTVFYVADMAPRILTQVLTPITRPFFPILAGMFATQDYVKLRNTYTRTARYHTWVVLTIAIPAMVFSTEIMHLYLHGKYDSAGPIMTLLLIVTVVNALNALGSAVALATGDMRGLSLRVIIVQAVNLLLTIFLVVHLQKGAMGSAIATLLAALFFEITIKWPFCRRIAHTPFQYWFKESFIPTVVPAIPSLIFCLAINHFYQLESWLSLIGASVVSAMLYLFLVLHFCLRQQDKIDIAKISTKVPRIFQPLFHYLAQR